MSAPRPIRWSLVPLYLVFAYLVALLVIHLLVPKLEPVKLD